MSNASRSRDRKKELVHLKDLIPKKDPRGGGRAKPVFGQRPVDPEAESPTPREGPGGRKKGD